MGGQRNKADAGARKRRFAARWARMRTFLARCPPRRSGPTAQPSFWRAQTLAVHRLTDKWLQESSIVPDGGRRDVVNLPCPGFRPGRQSTNIPANNDGISLTPRNTQVQAIAPFSIGQIYRMFKARTFLDLFYLVMAASPRLRTCTDCCGAAIIAASDGFGQERLWHGICSGCLMGRGRRSSLIFRMGARASRGWTIAR